jgi:hypothetical protein
MVFRVQGKTFTLNIDDNVKQYRTGQATVTGSINTGLATTNNFGDQH